MNAAENLLNKIITLVINPILLVLFSTGFLLFVYGFVEYLRAMNKGDNPGISSGRQHMMWGIVGMLIMVSFNGIIALIENSFGLNPTNPNVSNLNNPPANFFTQQQ